MKLLLTIAISLFAFTATATEIRDARVNLENMTLEVDLSFGGGCEEHVFDLQMGMCLESFPVQCEATLLHSTKSGNPDFCEAYLHQTAVFSLEEKGLLDSYYSRASLTILGSGDSKASVRLP